MTNQTQIRFSGFGEWDLLKANEQHRGTRRGRRNEGGAPAAIFAAAFLLALAGCGKSNSAVTVSESKLGPDGVDVSAVQKSFQGANQSLRFALDDTFRIIQAGAYGDAIPALQKLSENPRITPDQKEALSGLIENLKNLPTKTAGP
jgi:hypothetical protein